jgi:RNA polymerase sigma factor (sigma-70 family)
MQKDTFKLIKTNNQAQIIEAIKNNNQVVLQSLYLSNYKKVEFLVLKNNGSVAHAKDIFQDSYIAVWKKIKNNTFIPKNETAINGFLYTVAKNKWMDYLRSSDYKKKVTFEEQHAFPNESDIENTKEEEHSKKLTTAMNAFKKLGEPCKELLTKYYFDKKSMKEIAAELVLDAASTRNKKYRCMQKLRELALKTT